jgi:hypothetical protein
LLHVGENPLALLQRLADHAPARGADYRRI